MDGKKVRQSLALLEEIAHLRLSGRECAINTRTSGLMKIIITKSERELKNLIVFDGILTSIQNY
jgi:hypothetical protein